MNKSTNYIELERVDDPNGLESSFVVYRRVENGEVVNQEVVKDAPFRFELDTDARTDAGEYKIVQD